jgi:hypothetical protein
VFRWCSRFLRGPGGGVVVVMSVQAQQGAPAIVHFVILVDVVVASVPAGRLVCRGWLASYSLEVAACRAFVCRVCSSGRIEVGPARPLSPLRSGLRPNVPEFHPLDAVIQHCQGVTFRGLVAPQMNKGLAAGVVCSARNR